MSSTSKSATPRRSSVPSAPTTIPGSAHQLELLIPLSDKHTKSIGLWDLTPWQVYFTPAELRRGDFLKSIHRTFEAGGRQYALTLRPARIMANGKEIEKYAGDREHLVELAIRKLAVINREIRLEQGGDQQDRVGLSLGIYEIYNELKLNGHTFSYAQIEEALQILNKAQYEIVRLDPDEDGDTIETGMSGSIFPFMVLQKNQNRKKEEGNRVVIHVNPLIAEAIKGLDYYDVSYKALMMLKPIARWIFKRLHHEMIFQVDSDNPRVHVLKASGIRTASGMSEYARDRQSFDKITSYMQDLVEAHIISGFKAQDVIEGRGRARARIDAIYTITVSDEFLQEAAQARQDRNAAVEDFTAVTGRKPREGFVRQTGQSRVDLAKRREKRRAGETARLPLLDRA